MRPALRRALTLLAVPAAAFGVLAAEGVIAARREYLPNDPGYVIDQTVGDGGGEALELVVVGDSTTAGVGSPTEASSLPVLVAGRVARALGRPVHVRSIGISGAKTLEMFDVQVPLLSSMGRVDLVMVIAGGNDTPRFTPFWQLQEHTEILLRAVADATAAPVVLGGIPRFSKVDALAQPLRQVVDSYGGVLRAAQRRAVAAVPGTSYVDIAGLASPRFVGVPDAMSVDRFHPAPIGYGFWADALAPGLVAALTA